MLIVDPFLDLIISSTSLNITDNDYAIFAVFPYMGHSMSDHPMLETVPPHILIKSYTFGLCD